MCETVDFLVCEKKFIHITRSLKSSNWERVALVNGRRSKNCDEKYRNKNARFVWKLTADKWFCEVEC